jgi:hypothetical protein
LGAANEQARLAGLAWEKLEEPRPRLYLEIVAPGEPVQRIRLGPHAPELSPEDLETLHRLWLNLTARPELRQLHHYQVLSAALGRLEEELGRRPESAELEEMFRRLNGKN